jgi:hypothetical protein
MRALHFKIWFHKYDQPPRYNPIPQGKIQLNKIKSNLPFKSPTFLDKI